MNTELEEAAGKLYPLTGEVGIDHRNYLRKEGFINGAKYQAERMYSKEDLEKAYEHGKLAIIDMGHGDTFEEWFDQFKKK
jgi:hypothetical protein